MLMQLWYNINEKEPAWIGVILLGIIYIVIMYRRAYARGSSAGDVIPIYRGYAFFMLGYVITRFLFILTDYERLAHGDSVLFNQINIIAYISGIVSSLSLLLLFEATIFKKKRILSTIYLSYVVELVVVLIITFITPPFLAAIITPVQVVNVILGSLGSLIIMGCFIKIIQNSTGKLKTNSILTFVSILLITIGSIIDGELFIRSLNAPIWVPALFPAAGILLMMYSQKSL